MTQFVQQLVNGVTIGGTYALIAVGFTLIFGVLRFVYMAHGDVMMVGAYVGMFTVMLVPSVPVALVGAMAVTGLTGFLIERIALRPVRGRHHLMPLVTTVSMGIILQELVRLNVLGGQPVSYPAAVRTGVTTFRVGSIFFSSLQLTVLAVSFLLMLGLSCLVHRTWVGRSIRAVAQDADVAAMLGVNIDRTAALTFVVSSALTGAAGVLFGLMFAAITPYIGESFGFKALAIVLFGGLGSLPGAMLGGLLLGVVEALAVGYLQSSYRDAFAFATMIVILLVRPNGLFGRSPRLG